MGYIRIDQAFCKGCELCIGACPRQLIQLTREINRLGYHPAQYVPKNGGGKGCTGCAVCGLICPETAISVFRGEEV